MSTTATTTAATVTIPAILEANTYFWRPASSASGRRSSEKRRLKEIESFADLCMHILPGFSIEFAYEETCKRVYKKFIVKRLIKGNEWKKSNLLALKNALKKAGYLVK